MRVIIKQPYEPVGHDVHIRDNLTQATMQNRLENYVGGKVNIYPLNNYAGIAYCTEVNDENAGKAYPCSTVKPDKQVIAGRAFYGPIVVVGLDGPNYADLHITLTEWERYWLL